MQRKFISLPGDFFRTRTFASGVLRHLLPLPDGSSRALRPLNFCRSLVIAVIAVTASQPASSEEPIEIVNFQSLTFPGSVYSPPFLPSIDEATPATIFGILRLPPGTGRVPAVVVTHGCTGFTGAETYWGSHLVQLGVATFLVNSFAGRNIPRCTGHTISIASVLTDVYRARELLAAHPRIDPERIALMGFSFGGRTALWASQVRFQGRYDPGPSRFAAYLAFYPTNCHITLVDEDRVNDVPIRIFHGAADDATRLDRCKEYVGRLRQAGVDMTLFEYAGAKHWFDNADLTNRQTATGVLNFSNCTFVEVDGRIIDAGTGEPAGMKSPCVVAEGTFGYSPDAHRQASADVQGFLKVLLKLE
jgi:dienelactone hydrolase